MSMAASFPILSGPEYFHTSGLPLNVFRYGMGSYYRHGHAFYEVVLVAQGRGTHLLYGPDSDEADVYEIRENDVFLLVPGWSHAYRNSQSAEIYNVLWSPEFLRSEFTLTAEQPVLSRFINGEAPPLDEPITRKIHLAPAERAAFEACLRSITRELGIRQPGFEMLAKAKLVEALVLLERARAARSGGLGDVAALYDAGSPVAQAIAFMEARLVDDIGLDEISRAAHLSTAYFCEIFKSSTGLTPMKYLTRLRLEHARYLLLRGDLSINAVATRSGFQDSSYFARVFKQFAGITPRQVQGTGKKS